MIRQRREERLRIEERQKRQRLLSWLAGGAVGLLIVGIIGFMVVSQVRNQQARQEPPGVETFANLSQDHVDAPVQYEQTPPVGGPHFGIWQNCGYYPAPIRSENALHSLEHGAVWITYQPDLPAEQVEMLRSLADDQTYVLVSPFPDQPAPVVASAWGKQLRLESTDDPRLDQFVRAFRQGPQTPEPGAVCTGGTSEVA